MFLKPELQLYVEMLGDCIKTGIETIFTEA